MISLEIAECLLYLTYGHISGIFDQFLGESNGDELAGDNAITASSSIASILDHEDRKYVFQNLLYGDIEFLEVLVEATKGMPVEELMFMTGHGFLCPASFDLEDATKFIGLVKREIEKNPIKYASDSTLSRGVSQYAKALLSHVDD